MVYWLRGLGDMRKLLTLLCLSLTLLISLPVYADDSFIINKIKFEGLQRVTPITARAALALHAGDTFDSQTTVDIIHSLYTTGFFNDISVYRHGQTIIIQVHERPTVSSIKVEGNKLIETKQLMKVLKQMNLAEGQFFDNAMLVSIKRSLVQQYVRQGQYDARVETIVTAQSRNQ